MATLNPNNYAVQGLGTPYPLRMPPAFPGQEANQRALTEGFPRFNTGSIAVQSMSDMTVAGTIGTATFTLTFSYLGLLGKPGTKIVTHTATTGQTATDVAAALVAKINTDADVNDVLIASNVAGVISFAPRRFRKVTAIAGAATAAGTLTAASTVTQEATPTEIPYGYFVGAYPNFGANQCSAISTATNLTILGLARYRAYREAEWPYDESKTKRGYLAGNEVDIRTKGIFWVPVPTAVAKGPVSLLNATGQPCAAGAATSTVVANATYMSATTAAGLAMISLNLPAGV
jgi:hypothetical protein